jgi:hypothetical protein
MVLGVTPTDTNYQPQQIEFNSRKIARHGYFTKLSATI